MFWWHCVAAGTQVTLADGSTVPIERVDNCMRVRTGHREGTLGVEATSLGYHDDDGGVLSGVFELVTARGKTLTLTAFHPVATPLGPVAAKDLSRGAEVLAEDGVDAVSSCERISHEGLFFNLKLVNARDRALGAGLLYSTYVANGIIVGDHLAMEAHRAATGTTSIT